MNGPRATWIDGVAGELVPADDRGLYYGDGLFETILVRAGKPRFLQAHLARLDGGLRRLGIGFDASTLRADVALAVAEAPPLAVLKIIVTRGSGPTRGYAPSSPATPRRIVSRFDTTLPPVDSGVELRIANLRVGAQPALAGLKHLNRLENVLAAAEPGHATHFESLLRSASGDLVGGTMSNVFAVHGGRVTTPPVAEAGVAGVMRGVVLRECARLGIAAAEGRLTVADLQAADEVFITNARLGVVPARRVGEHAIPMREISSRLRSHVEALDA
jgi:4-amino-4-deoxychorismate lyase